MTYVRGKRPNTRLLGCWCFVNLASSGALDEEVASGRTSEAHVTSDTIVVVHAILRLFEEPHKAVKVPNLQHRSLHPTDSTHSTLNPKP